MEANSLAPVWFYILGALLFLYVVLDGFDLGIGILTLFNRDAQFHKASIEIIHGVWHANQTWLIVFAAGLFGVFPQVYGAMMAALYLPVALMLIGLIGRGVALEFHYFYPNSSPRLVSAFAWGSLLAAIAQGLGVGTFLLGLPMENSIFTGGVWYWLSPLPIILAVGLPMVYALLGAVKMVGQTEGSIQDTSRRFSIRTAALTIAAAAVFLLWCLISRPIWTEAWLSWPGALTTFVLLLVGALLFIPLFALISKGRGNASFLLTAGIVGLFFLGLANSLYPRILPPSVTIAQAAADPVIQKVMLVGFGVALPLVLIYTIYMYRVFGGKVRIGE